MCGLMPHPHTQRSDPQILPRPGNAERGLEVQLETFPDSTDPPQTGLLLTPTQHQYLPGSWGARESPLVIVSFPHLDGYQVGAGIAVLATALLAYRYCQPFGSC